jgi:hypothetical protein
MGSEFWLKSAVNSACCCAILLVYSASSVADYMALLEDGTWTLSILSSVAKGLDVVKPGSVEVRGTHHNVWDHLGLGIALIGAGGSL